MTASSTALLPNTVSLSFATIAYARAQQIDVHVVLPVLLLRTSGRAASATDEGGRPAASAEGSSAQRYGHDDRGAGGSERTC